MPLQSSFKAPLNALQTNTVPSVALSLPADPLGVKTHSMCCSCFSLDMSLLPTTSSFFPPLLRKGLRRKESSAPRKGENRSGIRMLKRYVSRELFPFVGANEFALIEDVTFHDLKELIFG
jgi:hypothetical protein